MGLNYSKPISNVFYTAMPHDSPETLLPTCGGHSPNLAYNPFIVGFLAGLTALK